MADALDLAFGFNLGDLYSREGVTRIDQCFLCLLYTSPSPRDS